MSGSYEQLVLLREQLFSEFPQQVKSVEWYDDSEGQITLVIEIVDSNRRGYITEVCRDLMASFLGDPYAVPLLVSSVESAEGNEGLFSLSFRSNIKTFFVKYYPPNRLRSNPYIVPIYYRKMIESVRVVNTEHGKSLENADVLWKRLFPASYEKQARQRGIPTFTARQLAAPFRKFLIDNLKFLEDVALLQGDQLQKVPEVGKPRPKKKESPNEISPISDNYRVLSMRPPIVWVQPKVIRERVDAHPFQPKFIEVDEHLARREDCHLLEQKLRSDRDLTGGATPLGANYLSEGNGNVRFIRTQNITPNWIDLSDIVYISREDNQTLDRSALQENDVLLTITGALFGQSATVYSECLPANINQHSVRMHFTEDVNPRFVSAFLNSKYGQSQIQMHKVGATRSAIDYEGVRSLRMPIPLGQVQDYIGGKILLAERCRKEARKQTEFGDQILRQHIKNVELVDFGKEKMEGNHYRVIATSPKIVSVEPQQVAMKLIPEIYSPNRLRLIEALKNSESEFVSLKEIAEEVSGSRLRGTRSSINATYFVSILHVNDKGFIDIEAAATYSPVSPGKECREFDILFSAINPSQNRVAVWTRNELSLCSAEFAIINAKRDISPLYLAFVCRSEYCLRQIESLTGGTSSSRRRFELEDLEELLIPLIPETERDLVANFEYKNSCLEKKARELINEGIKDVEALIDGSLDVGGILAGNLTIPAWETINNEIEAQIAKV